MVYGTRPGTGSYPPAPMIQQGASSKPWPFAGEVLAERLVAAGYLQKPLADRLLAEAASSGTSLVTRILDQKQMTPEALRDAISRVFGLPVADLSSIRIDPALISSFPSELARKHVLLPLHREGDRLVMVVADPTPAETIRLVRRVVGLTIDMRLATFEDLGPVVNQYFAARLVALLPTGDTLDVIIPAGEIKIGRSDHNDVVLPDPTVGSTHAVLRAHGDEYQIVDFGSRNGVFVDGQRINQSQTLKNGDVIQIGQCLLTFKLPLPEAAQSHDGATQLLTPEQVGLPGGRVSATSAARSAGSAPFAAPGVAVAVEDDKNGKKKKKKKKGGEEAKLKSAWIGFIGRILAQIVGAVATIILGLAVAGKLPTSCGTAGVDSSVVTPPANVEPVKPTSFGEKINGEDVNASGVAPVGDSRFLIVDNNTSDALFELQLDAQGKKVGNLVRRALPGLSAANVDDFEGLTFVEEGGTRYLIATTSLHNKSSKKKGEFGEKPSGLVRITVAPDGTLKADLFPNFRKWFAANVKEVANSDMLEPDEGGLNVEGLAWDPTSKSLLFGVRTPLTNNNLPMVVPVKVNSLAGAWDASNFQAQQAVELKVENVGDRQGVRAIEFDPTRGAFLVVVGNATSMSKAPFQLYTWDGQSGGAVTRMKGLWFDKDMKPEGITPATVAGKPAIVIMDDGGGYAVVYNDDPRLTL